MDQLPGIFCGHLKLTTPKIVIFLSSNNYPTVSLSGTSQTCRLPEELVKILIQKVRGVAQDSVFLTSSQSMLMLLVEGHLECGVVVNCPPPAL